MPKQESHSIRARRAVLRIHGIGQHSVTKVIGPASEVVDSAHLYQSHSDPTLFALSWSRLTRTGFAVLSFLLFPFAILNAAGFMTLTAGQRSEHFNGSGVLKVAYVTVSASWVLWGLLLFWDLPVLADSATVFYLWRGIGVALGLLITVRIVTDLSSRLRVWHQQSPVARAMGTPLRHWFGHYFAVALLVWFCLAITNSGGSGLYTLLWVQIILIIGPVGWLARLFYALERKPHGLLSTDAALIACLLSHIAGYSLVQACAMVFLLDTRQIDFYFPAGLVAGVRDDRIDTVFFICTIAAVVWGLVGVAGIALRRVVKQLLSPLRSSDGAESMSGTRIERRLERLKARAARPPLRPKVSWLLTAYITFVMVEPTRRYSRGIGDVPPWLWTLPWRWISVVFAGLAVVMLALIVFRTMRGRSLFSSAFDVLGFLPRQFHPWSPAFYADAAIRETHAAIRTLAKGTDLVWVVGHSQGSVIAYAALVTLEDEIAAKCRLITCGSPLMRLYGHFFPTWFTPARVAELSTRLSHDEQGVSWWNFHRCTDQIAAPLRLPTQAVRDIPLHESQIKDGRRDQPKPLGHSDYWDDPLLAGVVRNDVMPTKQGASLRCCGQIAHCEPAGGRGEGATTTHS